jgi:hypothetical protein
MAGDVDRSSRGHEGAGGVRPLEREAVVAERRRRRLLEQVTGEHHAG